MCKIGFMRKDFQPLVVDNLAAEWNRTNNCLKKKVQ